MWRFLYVVRIDAYGTYGSFLFLLVDEHDEKADRQQCAGHPMPRSAKALVSSAPRPAPRKKSDHAEVGQRFVQHLAVVRVEVNAQRLRAAAHIADAHRARVGWPRTLRKVCTCMAQTNETSALAAVLPSCGRKPTRNSSTISAKRISCRQCTLSMCLKCR